MTSEKPSIRQRFRREPEPGALVASGLMAIDCRRLVPLILIAALPNLIEAAVPRPSELLSFGFTALRELAALSVMAIVGSAWVQRLRRTGAAPKRFDVARAIIAGCAVWILGTLPFLLPFLPPPFSSSLAGILITVPGAVIAWRYLFLPAAILLGRGDLRLALERARALTRADPALPARVIVPALGIKTLLLALLYMADPDGRAALTAYGTAIFSAGGTVISVYLASGFVISSLPEKTWSELELDPYRQARTSSLIIRSQGIVARLCTLRWGALFLGIGILLWGGNAARLAELPPAGTVAVESVIAKDQKVAVTLDLSDPAYRFRALRPVAFSLAGENGFPIARRPVSAEVVGVSGDARFFVPRDHAELKLRLIFETERTDAELAKLQDLHLWYAKARLQKISLAPAPAPGS